MLESRFQAKLIRELKSLFPGCEILKNDPNYIQGIPDLLILYENKWAALECKREPCSPTRPNQKYYIDKLGRMSYASFIFPQNMQEVLDELQRTFSS